jgi:hypothetical protein
VLTGGLSQSRFFQQVFHAGVKLLAPKAKILISARKGPMRYQTAAYGALLNAISPEDPHAGAKLCATKTAARPDAASNAHLQYLLKSQGLQALRIADWQANTAIPIPQSPIRNPQSEIGRLFRTVALQ